MDNAVILSEGVFGTTYGKTANGLIRYGTRFRPVAVIDSTKAGMDAGEVLEGRQKGIPIVASLQDAMVYRPSTLVVGIASDGGFLPKEYRPAIREGLERGLNVVCGLHEFLSDDSEFSALAKKYGCTITDVRKMFRDMKIPYTGKIREVRSFKIAVLGTDSAVGKRTTAVYLNRSMQENNRTSVMIGTGQTAWMQGFPYTVVIDAMINDFISGNLEDTVYRAWKDLHPDFIFLEGQGSILHPAYPGSFEIIAACRPDAIILQHSPSRVYYDGFPDFKIESIEKYIKILQLVSGKPVIAVSLNLENIPQERKEQEITAMAKRIGIPVFDPLSDLREITKYIETISPEINV
ncbi:MAG: DUF1611 domain-containing protein [Candidatus Thermoplasmatota archaeon]|nr:DUF1611 domain-containing protein [Candidatus Thermoplasmatota archaeon]